ncbi:MAG: hypothetical protein Q7S05_01905 [bacterium]|nr:hypothetical protein [bacterium]
MFGVSSSHKKKQVAVVVDIGSGHVGYALVEVRGKEIPIMLAYARSVLPFEERTPAQTKSAILSLVGEMCKKAAETYSGLRAQKSLPPISASYAIFQGPWARSEISRAETAFEIDRRINGEMIEGLGRHALESANKLDTKNLFEAAVIRVDLNGYPTLKPLGKQAHAIAVSTLISECEPDISTKVEEILKGSFPSAKPNLRSRVCMLLSALSEVKGQPRDSVIIDMENEATNCIVVRHGLATEHFLVPEGTRTILKRISKVMPEETLSLMRMVSRGTCSTPECEKLNASLALAEPDIVRVFGDALVTLIERRRLPNYLVLIAEPALSEWLSVLFSKIDFSQFTITTRQFTPVALTPEGLRESVLSTGTGIDAGLLLAASFVNREEQSTG